MKIEKRDIKIIEKESKFYKFLTTSQRQNYLRRIENKYGLLDYENYSNKDNIEYCISILEDDFANNDLKGFIKDWEL